MSKNGVAKIKRGKKENLEKYFNISNQVLTFIKEDTSFINEYREFTSKDFNYNDTSLHLLTQDFIYTVANHFEEENMKTESNIPAYYCVGFHFYGENPTNQLPKFIDNNIWINGYDDKFVNVVNEVPLGSLIAAKTSYTMNENEKTISVLEVHCIGKVIKNHKDGKNLEVEWEKDFQSFILKRKGGYRSTISKVQNQANIDAIFYNRVFVEDVIEDEEQKIQNTKYPLNQILYGAPGTGKTYKTKKLAVEIIENVEYSDSKEDRDIIIEKYKNYVDSENIFFTTFHQSMSYEDFIEGIKPKMDEDEEKELSYRVEDGIFKIICEKASNSLSNVSSLGGNVEVISFEKGWAQLVDDYTEKSSKSETFTLSTSTEMGMDIVGVTNKGNLLLKPSKGGDIDYTVSYNRMQKLFNAFPDLSVVNNIDKEFRQVIGGSNSTAYWCVLNYLLSSIKKNKEQLDILVTGTKREENNFVLIIDEINRGNVSAIFGELITLIEEDKRTGEKEALNVTLPYSKIKFSVPNNVFIIGTMNTADRSVEALDTALRRRFSFEEVSPRPELLKELEYQDVDLEKVLDTINQRIELLIDKDHQIGHSYFFSINSLDDLKRVFKDRILPLLEEYFYGDFGKIGLVLGENFVEELKAQNKNILATFKAYDDIDFVSDKKIFRLKNIDEMSEQDFISIYLEDK